MFEAQPNNGQVVLLWRFWKPLFNFPATFSCLQEHSVGGTDSQLLWHARILRDMGYRVQVLGATAVDIVEEGVDFIGAANREEQEKLIDSGRVTPPNLIFMEGAFAGAELFRSRYPNCKIIHVGQNIDRLGHQEALSMERFIDTYGFVGVGQLANYCVKFPHLRHKFLLLRNVVPWEGMYQQIPKKPVTDHIAWVGAWNKKGLRQWAQVMQPVLRDNPSYRWKLYGPSHGTDMAGLPPSIFNGIDIPTNRISVESLPLLHLLQEISSARLVLVSLGNECGPISILDVHAMGRPALSGNDMVYKYANPEGTGVRITTAREGYESISHLLDHVDLCEKLGARGQKLIETQYTERNQYEDIERIIEFLEIQNELKGLARYPAPSTRGENWSEIKDKVVRKRLSVFGR